MQKKAISAVGAQESGFVSFNAAFAKILSGAPSALTPLFSIFLGLADSA